MNKEEMLRAVNISLAKKNFWTFCKCLCPKVYNEEHQHLKKWCEIYQKWYETGDKKYLLFNAPPRHGKSLTAQLFAAWVLGNNPEERVMVLCYSKELSVKFSRAVRSFITSKHLDKDEKSIFFCDIFPGAGLKGGEGAAGQWSVKGSVTTSFYSCSINSTITGFGATLLIIDDIVSNDVEARNEELLRDRYQSINDTVLQSRVEEGGKVICSSTRWAKADISGQLLEDYGDECEIYTAKAYDEENDKMLCPAMLSKENYLKKKMHGDIAIFMANFQQELLDENGRLYEEWFKTWNASELPLYDNKGRSIIYKSEAMIDVADKGTDYLACIFYYPMKDGRILVKDILFSNESLNKTEPEIIKGIKNNDTILCILEGNNGGAIFKELLQKDYKEQHGNTCVFKYFTQTKNKESRILNQAPWVQENIYFPEGWQARFPQFYEALYRFQRDFKSNKHDDAADCITMIADKYNSSFGKGLKIY